MAKFNRKVARDRRHTRIRRRVEGTESRPRLSVFRSLTNVYAQVIDDTKGITLVSASSLDEEIKKAADGKKKVDVSKMVGALVAKRAKERVSQWSPLTAADLNIMVELKLLLKPFESRD